MKMKTANREKRRSQAVKSRATGTAKKEMSAEKTAKRQKMQAYRFAFFLIDEAIRNHFYIEAIALEESIISDRLNSILGKLGMRPHPEKEASFGGLTTLVKEKAEHLGALIERLAKADLSPARLDEWRIHRNQFVHEMVHGMSPLAPGMRGKEYFSAGKEVATIGKKFARIISDWARTESRRIEALNKGSTSATATDRR